MTPEQLHVYTEEVYLQTRLALGNRATFLNLTSDQGSRQSREVWMFLQSFLSHEGMVSKLLFAPTGKSHSKERASALRAHLGIDAASAIDNREARNAIEHLDERLDYWLLHPEKGLLEAVFENRQDYDFLEKDRWSVRRAYLIEEDIFITGGPEGTSEMPLTPIDAALGELMKVCERALQVRPPFQYVQPGR